jgi:hypothetical protein
MKTSDLSFIGIYFEKELSAQVPEICCVQSDLFQGYLMLSLKSFS